MSILIPSAVRRQLPSESPRPTPSPRNARSRLVGWTGTPEQSWIPHLGMATIHITIENVRKEYWLQCQPINPLGGMDFTLTALDDHLAEYEVHIDLAKSEWWCTCKGYHHAGHCKHVCAIYTMLEAGRLYIDADFEQTGSSPHQASGLA